ncbi:unnamed protein product [Notodromas monacha]|uniref:Sphingomyelin phosphodiesterase n=1 Tax=Notodromas monacha TaxID=399045 RepID=A0A7R9BV68_9CRUS|nr:unnamed protein product [Notodromas monacha]CAG0921987.1 unnamed protein product [Notodromas monacha]
MRLLGSVLLMLASVGAKEKMQPSSQVIFRDTAEFWVPWAKDLSTRDPTRPIVDIPCFICTSIFNSLVEDLNQGFTTEDIINALIPVCSTFLYEEDICRGILEATVLTLGWVLSNHSVNMDHFCAFAIGSSDCTISEDVNSLWTVPIPDVAKPVTETVVVPEGVPLLKILHFADVHLDLLYEVGSEANCGKPLCCQSTSGPGLDVLAGIFGAYEPCDTPQNAIDDAFQHILATHPDLDMIIFTGDIPPHDLWAQSVESNLAAIAQFYDTMVTYFGDKAVLMGLGNHDPHPCNVFSFAELGEPAELSTNYIYDDAWENWKHWLPADQEANVRKTGQYSVSPRPGLRVLVFNNLLGYVNNWMVWSGIPDPNAQLEWLAGELQLAENAGEKVFLIGHIPPGSRDLTPVWSHNFNRIVNRYENIIKAQFYGHTHWDEFNVFFNEEGLPSNVAYITPSLTTYEYLNYGYRIFYVDGAREADSTWAVVDHETWIYQLDEANNEGMTTWFKAYSMLEEFRMSDLSPTSYASLGASLATDDVVFDKYYRHYWKNSPVRPVCDAECRATLACDSLTSDVSDTSHCVA